MKVIIRLLIVALIIVGIGWLVITFVSFPGNFANLQKLSDKNYAEVTMDNYSKLGKILSFEYDVTNFKQEVLVYTDIANQVKNTFEDITIKDGFSWEEEKELKGEMKVVYSLEKKLNSYISSIIIYVESGEAYAETVQNMIDNSVNKLTEITAKYNQLKIKTLSYSVQTETAE